MFFTPDQVVEYDEIKAKYGIEVQISIVFDIIYSESDAIQWLKERLRKEPQTYQQIMADFRSANPATRKGETGIELKLLLIENFIEEEDGKSLTRYE